MSDHYKMNLAKIGKVQTTESQQKVQLINKKAKTIKQIVQNPQQHHPLENHFTKQKDLFVWKLNKNAKHGLIME